MAGIEGAREAMDQAGGLIDGSIGRLAVSVESQPRFSAHAAELRQSADNFTGDMARAVEELTGAVEALKQLKAGCTAAKVILNSFPEDEIRRIRGMVTAIEDGAQHNLVEHIGEAQYRAGQMGDVPGHMRDTAAALGSQPDVRKGSLRFLSAAGKLTRKVIRKL